MELTFGTLVRAGEALLSLNNIPMKAPVAVKIARNLLYITPYIQEYITFENSLKGKEETLKEEVLNKLNTVINCDLAPLTLNDIKNLHITPQQAQDLLPIITLGES